LESIQSRHTNLKFLKKIFKVMKTTFIGLKKMKRKILTLVLRVSEMEKVQRIIMTIYR